MPWKIKLKHKRDLHGHVARYQAHLIANWCIWKDEVYYSETFEQFFLFVKFFLIVGKFIAWTGIFTMRTFQPLS